MWRCSRGGGGGVGLGSVGYIHEQQLICSGLYPTFPTRGKITFFNIEERESILSVEIIM
jgi:hypothetical protein